MKDSVNGINITILNNDGTKIAVPVEEIYEAIRKNLLLLQTEINKLLKSYGVEAFISTFKITEDQNLMTDLLDSVYRHNGRVVQSLISKHNEKSVQEFKLLTDLAKDVNIKIEMDTNDWNKLALEVSKKERESHGGGSYE